MAERKQQDDERAETPATPPAPSGQDGQDETPQQRTQRLMARDAAEAQEKRLDETVPGGRYRREDGTLVDANGAPLKG